LDQTDVEVVGTARTGREAISMAGDVEPHVILMDINMPDMDGISATELIRRDLPWAQIVILSVQGDPNYMRRAMQAGAKDFLTKPPTIDELISAIRKAGEVAFMEREKSDAMNVAPVASNGGPGFGGGIGREEGRIIVVYSPKGGTGKSVIATNLAVALQRDDNQVVIVDGNLQFGNVSVFFNEQGKNHIGDLTPRIDELDKDVVEEVLITHRESGVKILAAPPRPEFAEDISGEQFQALLNYLRLLYPYIVIDTTSALTEFTLAAIDSADYVILISTQDIPSIANSKLFLDLASALDLSSDNLMFVMNRYDKRINISPERVAESFNKSVETVIPLDSRSVIPAVNRGVPFMVDSKISSQPIGKAIRKLADKIYEKTAL
jgi:pilus assembly protein CpaE